MTKRLAALLGPELSELQPASEFNSSVPYELEVFDETKDPTRMVVETKLSEDQDVDVSFEFGRLDLTQEDFVGIRLGSVLQLDKLAQDPVDIVADGRLIASGEVIVLADKFCIRVAEVLSPTP